MMRRITKFFLFFLVGLSLAGCVLNCGGLYLLHDVSNGYNKRDLRHWLSLQARVEALEEAADVFHPLESEAEVSIPCPAETTAPEPPTDDTVTPAATENDTDEAAEVTPPEEDL